jgi:hypothetical protein
MESLESGSTLSDLLPPRQYIANEYIRKKVVCPYAHPPFSINNGDHGLFPGPLRPCFASFTAL